MSRGAPIFSWSPIIFGGSQPHAELLPDRASGGTCAPAVQSRSRPSIGCFLVFTINPIAFPFQKAIKGLLRAIFQQIPGEIR